MPVKIQVTMSLAVSSLEPQRDYFSHLSKSTANLVQLDGCLLRTGVAGGEREGAAGRGGSPDAPA